ncbi:calcineurin B-like protein 7 isoform X2 [Rhodamnia argentea]|uniref:Calcineurin B-like protein n=1 Tax=Rhodamnia argentea TaxID=178133 RepID=A0A8B8P5S8_9MYRT|nr:calcineurin B-like protein 7 isoform X2 [Rhodamnia argentea]
MGCICTKHRFGHKDFEALASQTCFNAGEVEALYVLFKKLSSCLVDDGLISKEELQLGLLQSRKKRSLFTDRMFHLFDLKHDGVIEFQEFVHSLSVFHPSAPREEKALFAFQLYDIWQTGFIGRREVEELILALLKESDLILPWDAVDAIIDKTFQEADGKRDGKIDLEEWREFAAKNPSILKNMTIPYLKDITTSFPSFEVQSDVEDDTHLS